MEDANNCNFCGKEFSSRPNLKAHLQSHHEELRLLGRKKRIKCNICGLEVFNQSQLITHMRTHTGERPFKCTVTDCGKTFKQPSTLKDHIKRKHSDERPFKCEFTDCNHTAKTFADISLHVKVHNYYRPLYCPNPGCNFQAKHMKYITRHVRHAHRGVEPFACSKCDYKTMRADNMKRHMHRHSNTRDFKCSHPECTEAFKSSSELGLHFNNRHGERNIQCDHLDCGRKYASFKALRDHKRAFHSKNYICSKRNCGYRTNTASKLSEHMLYHVGRNKTVSCSIEGCGYKGKNRSALHTHMSRHKIYLACPASGCGRHFSTKGGLHDHVKLHNPSGRPFQCRLCFRHYPTLSSLMSHCAVHTNERPFGCGHCDYAAASRSSINVHISSAHQRIKFPFIVLPLGVHECLHCEVTLPAPEFLVHSMGHVVPVVMIERLGIKM